MRDFTYYNPVRIVFGTHALDALADLVADKGPVLLVAGGGSIRKNGVYDKVKAALAAVDHEEFWGISPNPDYAECMAALEQVRRAGIRFLLAVGGGSVLDAAKFIAAAARFDGDPWDILAKGAPVTDALPLGSVLTLPATGSEVNGNSVISRRELGAKLAFSSPAVLPVFSLLDPATTVTLDARQTANGIVDAFVHVMEQYLTYDVGTPLQDRQAEAVLTTLVETAPAVLADPGDLDARATIMWCASCALDGRLGCGTVSDWSTHVIGHELTAAFGLDHARTLAIVLPAVMHHQRRQKEGKIRQYGQRVWGIPADAPDAVDQTIAKTRAFFEEVGCPTRLSAYGISTTQCVAIPHRIAVERNQRLGEHGDIGEAEIRAILELCA